jgi:hypothetical protein
MGAVLFWLGIGLVIALVLLAARATDRRARQRGHHLRSGGDMSSAALEQRRDTVASDGMGHLNSDRLWTSPRNRGPLAPTRRRCVRLRRLAARRLGGPEDTKPAMRWPRGRWPAVWWQRCCWSREHRGGGFDSHTTAAVADRPCQQARRLRDGRPDPYAARLRPRRPRRATIVPFTTDLSGRKRTPTGNPMAAMTCVVRRLAR